MLWRRLQLALGLRPCSALLLQVHACAHALGLKGPAGWHSPAALRSAMCPMRTRKANAGRSCWCALCLDGRPLVLRTWLTARCQQCQWPIAPDTRPMLQILAPIRGAVPASALATWLRPRVAGPLPRGLPCRRGRPSSHSRGSFLARSTAAAGRLAPCG